ncbi:hypothetical protein CIL05_09735 [Virgibacillus profundi]|uniref:Uncharacterized protein n=2 Tax=Virgibacillus profundi TaxID=2024555 RepID=A0A2A2IEG2_9BACI|nr:hypothetical protein CIL05_09735 [Virgibacillus profundi]PXY53816.1 hypothetical protein CIT14_09825 [Virgibacillus profundi]
MEETISLHALKAFIEKKMKKKILVKVMWNDHEKVTLFITPNIKINSFIYDDKEAYLFYDHEGKLIKNEIPCILTERELADGKVILRKTKGGKTMIYNLPLSNEDVIFLREFQ